MLPLNGGTDIRSKHPWFLRENIFANLYKKAGVHGTDNRRKKTSNQALVNFMLDGRVQFIRVLDP